MGKRKRRAEPNRASTSDVLPQSSEMDAFPQQEPSPEVENSASTPIATILDVVDSSVKLQKISQLPVQQHRLSRVMLLRNPSLYARKYSRRNTSTNADASTSHEKVIPSHDENKIPKTDNKSHSDDFEQQTETTAARTVQRPAEPMVNSFSTDAPPSHNMKNMCRICYRPLKKKAENPGQSFSHAEPSVVAVLVCGHLYHADCLEERTSPEDQTDPSCPLCGSLKSCGEA